MLSRDDLGIKVSITLCWNSLCIALAANLCALVEQNVLRLERVVQGIKNEGRIVGRRASKRSHCPPSRRESRVCVWAGTESLGRNVVGEEAEVRRKLFSNSACLSHGCYPELQHLQSPHSAGRAVGSHAGSLWIALPHVDCC